MEVVGKGVWVGVGGNQTVVAVGVMVGGKGVLLANGGRGVEIGRQAANTARNIIDSSSGKAIFMR